jgi:1,6-anhydro-N-acetylmuramate kinase
LVNYLDGGQETIKYPDRLATQLKNSHQMSNLVDSEGKSWFEENKVQMRNFTEQQVREVLIKQNLQPHQTFQTQKIIERQQPILQPTPKSRLQPKETQRHEIGLSHTPTPQPQVYDLVDKDLDKKMEQQHHDIEDQYAFKAEQAQDKKGKIAQRFSNDLGEELPPYQKAFSLKKN